MVNRSINKRALFAFVFSLAFFLLLADFLVVYNQRSRALEEYKQHSAHELRLLGSLISESLVRNDYANIERFINEWGADYKQIIQISILTTNDFLLASYERPELISANILTLKQKFSYGDEKFFTIEVIKDSTLIFENITRLSKRLVLFSLFFVLVMGIFLWRTLRITAINPLQREIAEHQITEKKLQEHATQLSLARDEALRASRHKSEFLANMSHELRTPLNSIIGFTSIVKDGLAGPVNEEQKKQLELVYTSSEHLLGLINSILDLAKVEAGKYETDKSSFNLQALLEELRSSLQPQADEKLLSFTVNINCIDDVIHTDRNMLLQILLNLTSNAIKFTEQGSITLDCEQNDSNLVIKVIDTGIGISTDSLQDIFDAFRQVDSSTTRKYEGTGLGLSISQHFSAMLGGKLEVESKEGNGTTFTLTLPVSR